MHILLHVTIVVKKRCFFFLSSIIDLIAIHCIGRLIEATVYFIQAMKIHKYCFLVNKINICKHYSSFNSEPKHIQIGGKKPTPWAFYPARGVKGPFERLCENRILTFTKPLQVNILFSIDSSITKLSNKNSFT